MQDWDADHSSQVKTSTPTLGALSEVSYRGALNVTGRVQSPCSTAFLLTLSMEFFRASAYSMAVVVKEANEEQQVARLRFLTHEVQRLIQNPRLFPSTDVEARFLALLGLESRNEFGKACSNLLVEAEMRKMMHSSLKNETRKSYVDGSKGWENFLLNDAPGIPIPVIQTTPKSVFQVVPAAGMRIVADYEREEAEILRFIKQCRVPLDVQNAKTTLLVDFDKPTPPEEIIPEITLPQQSQAKELRPNPFAEHSRIRLSLTTSAAKPLEQFSLFINRLEQPPPPPHTLVPVLNGPNLFPVLTLRSWQPPTRLQDLRFMR